MSLIRVYLWLGSFPPHMLVKKMLVPGLVQQCVLGIVYGRIDIMRKSGGNKKTAKSRKDGSG